MQPSVSDVTCIRWCHMTYVFHINKNVLSENSLNSTLLSLDFSNDSFLIHCIASQFYINDILIFYIRSSGPECMIGSGQNYTGTLDEAVSGIKCEAWDSNSTTNSFVNIKYFADSQSNPSATIHDVSNYCRNPSLDGKTYDGAPWCYTVDNYDITEKQYCLIPQCQGQEEVHMYFTKITK